MVVGGGEEPVELAERNAMELVSRVDAGEGAETDLGQLGEMVAAVFVEAL